MTDTDLRATLLRVIGDDEQLHRLLCEAGFLPPRDEALSREHLELARVARTLASELEVNWEGIEIILRMRAELLATQRQVFELLRLLRGGPR
jgi:hypothetical protein